MQVIDILPFSRGFWAVGGSSRTTSLPSLAADSIFFQVYSEVRFILWLYYDGLNENVAFLSMVSQAILGLR